MKAPRSVSSQASAISDAEALQRVADGEVAALGDVYDRHARALLSFVTRLASRTEAEDIVHTVFLRAARLAATYDGRSPTARSWLYGITSNVISERRRSFGRTFRAMVRLGNAGGTQASQSADVCSDLERGLARLSHAKRAVLLLADLEGFTCDEIAKMLEIPVGTVWTRLHHARGELRAFYGEAPSP